MRNIAKAVAFAIAAFLWFHAMGRVLPLSWGFATVIILLLPTAACAIAALGYGVQSIADGIASARRSHMRRD